MRFALGVGGVLLGLWAGAIGDGDRSQAQVASGSYLTFHKWDLGRLKIEIVGRDPDRGEARRIVGGSLRGTIVPPLPGISGMAWLADGSRFLFSGHDRRGRQFLYSARADGSGAIRLPKTRGAAFPVVSPDGRLVAFSRLRIRESMRLDPKDSLKKALRESFSSTTTWILDTETGTQRRLSPWRNGLDVTPNSFSPDGRTLAVTRSGNGVPRILGLDLAGGPTRTLAANAGEGVFSPDGSRLAFVSFRDGNVARYDDGVVGVSELYVRSLSDGAFSRITFSKRSHESAPAWDPSGERLAYVRTIGPEIGFLGIPNAVMQINADGTCPSRVAGPRSAKDAISFSFPAWQPGPGREAGRIAC